MTIEARRGIRFVETTEEERRHRRARMAEHRRNSAYWNAHALELHEACPKGHDLIVVYGGDQVRWFDDMQEYFDFLDGLDEFTRNCSITRARQQPGTDSPDWR